MNNFGLQSQLKCTMWEYDFSVHGGAVGDITPTPLKSLPKGAIPIGGMIDVKTACASGTSAATIALKAETPEDVLAAKAVTSFTQGALLDVVPDGTAAKCFKMADYGGITVTIAGEDITAGVFVVYLFYLETR